MMTNIHNETFRNKLALSVESGKNKEINCIISETGFPHKFSIYH